MNRKLSVLFLVFVSFYISAESVPILNMQKNAEQALSENHIYQSIAIFKDIITKNPNYFDTRFGIAKAYFLLEEYDEALKHISKAIFLDGSSVNAKILYGRILTGKGDFKKAGLIFKAIIAEHANNIEAMIGMAELEVAQGNILEAIQSYKNALLKFPENRKALISSIILFDSLQKNSVSANYVEQVLNLYPDNAYVNYIAGTHYYNLNDINTALNFTKKSYKINSASVDTAYLLSLLYTKTGQYDLAGKVLEDSLSLNRENWKVWYMLGEVYLKLGLVDKSIYSFAWSITYSPQNELPLIALEDTLIDNRPLDDPTRGKYALYHFNRGLDLINKNYSIQARDEFRRGLLLDPHSIYGRKLYAELLKTEGYLNTYLSMLRKIAAEKPNDIELSDEVEIYNSLATDSVSKEWGVDQFSMETPRFKIQVFLNKSSISYNIFNEGIHLGSYFVHNLQGYENIDSNFNKFPSDFANAYEIARNTGSDYFLMFDYKDTPRSFSSEFSIYNSKTGTLLLTIPIFRTGNQKISMAFQEVSRTLDSYLPKWSKLVNRKFNKVLLNIGRLQGTEKGDVFYIIKHNDLGIKKDAIGLEFDPNLFLGEVEITKVDDLISEGVLKKYNFFDLINPGDSLIKKTESMSVPENTTTQAKQSLPVELYKSIISIP